MNVGELITNLTHVSKTGNIHAVKAFCFVLLLDLEQNSDQGTPDQEDFLAAIWVYAVITTICVGHDWLIP